MRYGEEEKMVKQFFKNQKGYFTLEASLIVPIVLLSTLGILLIGFYLYDLSVAKNFLNQEVSQITDTIKTNGKNDTGKFQQKELISRSLSYLLQSSYPRKAAEGKKRLKSKLQTQLIVSKVTRISITAGQNKVTGKVNLSFTIPVPVIGELTGRIWKNEITVTMENGSQAEQMRRWDSLE